jgi:starch-binding outer membrane protein, SusD/RagB family
MQIMKDRFIPFRPVVTVLASLALAACDLSVTNPGPMQDRALDDPAAHAPLVAGMSQALSSALWRVAYVGAEVSREYVQAGRIFTTKLPTNPGQLTRDDVASAFWNQAVRARWIAEDGVERLKRTRADHERSPLVADALIHAGLANRLLGENFCEAVFDGGSPEPGPAYFARAEAQLTEALAVATAAGDPARALTALAARATVRASRGDWTGAVADAAGVPLDFRFQAVFTNTELDQHNIIYWSNANQPFRTHSVIGTFYETYYAETGDPRVAWGRDAAVPNGELAIVPWLFQLKYRSRDAGINLVSGRELRLLAAEAALRDGDAGAAVAILNELRAAVRSDLDGTPLAPWPQPASLDDAWTHLKRERGIELWLEGRRLWDLRRWIAEGTPGVAEDMTDRIRLCFPIAQSEIDTNPNIRHDHPDPVNPVFGSR